MISRTQNQLKELEAQGNRIKRFLRASLAKMGAYVIEIEAPQTQR
jgi:hypothetical protein